MLGGYNDRAVRLQALYENGGFSALINGHARWLDGSAMVNRANAIELGDRSFVPGFDRDKVAQDGRNVLPVENQNYKIVSWTAIADALGLEKRGD